MQDKPRRTLQELFELDWEQVKPLDGLFEADDRYAEFIVFGNDIGNEVSDGQPLEEADTLRSYTLGAHYARFSLLSSPSGLPLEVHNAFVTAIQLALFSWVYFPLSALAEQQAYFALELALRRRMANLPAAGLKARLRHAVKKGWIKAEAMLELSPCLTAQSQGSFSTRSPNPRGSATLASLIEEFPRDRNWFAHGNIAHSNDPFMTLDLVRQLLQQLYSYLR